LQRAWEVIADDQVRREQHPGQDEVALPRGNQPTEWPPAPARQPWPVPAPPILRDARPLLVVLRNVLRTAGAIVRGPGPLPSPHMVLAGPSAYPTDCPGHRSRAGTPNALRPSLAAHPWALTRKRLAQPVGVSRASTRNPDWPCEHATRWPSLGPAVASWLARRGAQSVQMHGCVCLHPADRVRA